jgi:hypothetical protein
MVVSVLSFIAVFPRGIIHGEGSPFVYFSNDYYKQNLPSILAENIQALDRYIQSNQRVMAYRGSFLIAAVAVFIFMPPVTITLFLLLSF